jgi:ATP adenylyltransferase
MGLIVDRLWRPWRINYVTDIESIREEGCIFCTKPELGDDRESLILYRGKKSFIIMNLYPYNTGHIMISPFRHVAGLEDLEEYELKEIMELAILSVKAIDREMQPQGFNLGINLGKVAGAGFDEHIHFHVVPRWQGDTNFMPVVAEVKVMPESIKGTFEKLRLSIETIIAGEND